MDKRFWGFLVVVAIILGGIFIVTNNNKAGDSSVKGTLTNHVIGQGKSGVTLTEYGDYQCPACGQYYPVLKLVQQKYNEQIFFQFRNFPLFQIHPNAIAGARAAEAADQQGKYWEMHDMLYENQTVWSTATNPQTNFEKYAKNLGLNVTKFTTDYKSRVANDRIQADLKEGNKLGITGTPTLFIDGKKISTPDATLEAISQVVDAAIAQKAGDSASPASTPAQ